MGRRRQPVVTDDPAAFRALMERTAARFSGGGGLSGGGVEAVAEDAGNERGEVALREGDPAGAEAAFARALEAARRRLGRDGPDDHAWWLDLATRPYMRAREGIARARWAAGDLRGAVAEYRELLRRNPDDNQGARYLVAPLLLLAGDLGAALEAFREHDRDYPEDAGEPHYELSRALALLMSGAGEAAVGALRRALFANPYLIATALGHNMAEEPIRHGSNLAELPYARDYVAFSPAWERAPEAWNALTRFWVHRVVREKLTRWLDVGENLQREREKERGGGKTWRELLDEQRAIEAEALPPEVAADVLARPIPGDRRDILRRRVTGQRRKVMITIRGLDRRDLDRRDLDLDDLDPQALRALSKGDELLGEFEEALAADPAAPEPGTVRSVESLCEVLDAAAACVEGRRAPPRLIRGGGPRRRRAW